MRRYKSLLLVGLITLPVAAFTFGGWAVTTVEDVPEYAVAGKSFDLTYSVRQHGTGLLTRLGGAVTVVSANESRNAGVAELGEGQYRAKVTIPTPGTWDVNVSSGFMRSGTSFPLRVVAANAAAPTIAQYDRGLQLFTAKGCVTCHTHQLTKDFASVKAGPDLSEPKFAAPYLTRFLANPAIKTDWKNGNRMPNLGLKPAEISALIAFLNQDRK
jgi:cytochrome c2